MTQENSTAIGVVRFNHETSSIYIEVMPGFEYDIPKSRLESREEVQDWLDHIGEKNWGPAAMPDLKKIMVNFLPSSCTDEEHCHRDHCPALDAMKGIIE